MMKKYLAAALFAAWGLAAGEMLTITLTGNCSGDIASDFKDGWVLHQPFYAARDNRQFNFRDAFLTRPGQPKIPLGYSGDDACPWNVNSTYIGANHGDFSASAVICQAPHGLTEKDCGSTWRDPHGKNFHVLKIESSKVFWVLSDNQAQDSRWKFIRPEATQLKHPDGRVIRDFKVAYRQLYSPVRILKRNFYADGKMVPEKGRISCRVFSIEEVYDIVATDAILKHVLANPGKQVTFNDPKLEAFLTQKIVYTFRPDGSCFVTHDAKFHRDIRLGYMGFLQFSCKEKGKYARHLYYIPKTKAMQFEGAEWDFANQVDFSRPIKGSLYLRPEQYADRSSLPERFVQYLLDGPGQPNVGFVAGYSLIEGCTRPEIRAKQCLYALNIFRSRKSYPHAIDHARTPVLKAGDTIHFAGYRQYFDPGKGYYLNRQGKVWMLYVDFHAPVQGKRVDFPPVLKELKMSVVEKSPAVKLRLQDGGAFFDSPEKNGFAVLKFE